MKEEEQNELKKLKGTGSLSYTLLKFLPILLQYKIPATVCNLFMEISYIRPATIWQPKKQQQW